MSFPLSRATTYVASTTPAIKAADLNAIQDAIVGLYTGTLSVKALAIDGVGDNSITPNASQVLHSQSGLGAPTDKPLYIWQDQAGQNRGLIDHNGYRMGRVVEFVEPWLQYANQSGIYTGRGLIDGAGTVANSYLNLSFDLTNNATLTNTLQFAANSAGFTALNIVPGTGNTNYANFYSWPLFKAVSTSPVSGNTNLCAVLETTFKMSASGANNRTWFIGFCGDSFFTSGSVTSPNLATMPHLCGFKKASTDTNWFAITSDATPTSTTADTGVAPSTTFHDLRVELHYDGPYGSKARFFIDGSLTNEITTHLPADLVKFNVFGLCTGTGSSVGELGPVRIVYNQYASIPAL